MRRFYKSRPRKKRQLRNSRRKPPRSRRRPRLKRASIQSQLRQLNQTRRKRRRRIRKTKALQISWRMTRKPKLISKKRLRPYRFQFPKSKIRRTSWFKR